MHDAPPDRRPIIVQKFGGSSVADVERLGKVADRVVRTRNQGNDVVVVVSAMGKTTDALLSLAAQVAGAGGDQREPPRRELDMLVSTGERVSMALLSIAIQARGVDAISFTGSQSGILTNDRHFDARIIEVRPHRIEDELSRGRVVIVAGYQGMSYRREITTLGRGGSDTTAVALAAALGAQHCEIYSDVDGVYSADPRVVRDAVHLPEVAPDTLQEMAECGAKVLCAQAVEWARRAKISIVARSTFDPSPAPKQTLVRESTQATVAVRAVVVEPRIAFVEIASAPLEEVVAVLEACSIGVKDLTRTERGCSFLISLLNVPSLDDIRAKLRGAFGEPVIETGVSLVSVVGDGLAGSPEPLRRFVAQVIASGGAPRAVTGGPLRLSAVIDADHADEAQRALHAAFVVDG